jgi:hypothetical protein
MELVYDDEGCSGLLCLTTSAHKEMKKNDLDVFDRIIIASQNLCPGPLSEKHRNTLIFFQVMSEYYKNQGYCLYTSRMNYIKNSIKIWF